MEILKLPYECRYSFVKMKMLKEDTMALQRDKEQVFMIKK